MTNPDKKEQIKELDDWLKSNPDARELKRALAVKLALQDWRYDAIASTLNVSKSFVSKWKKQFQEAGIKGLKLSYQGRKSYLSPQEKETTIAWLHQQKYWDLSELECYLVQQYDVSFQSLTSYYNLISEARITWQKAKKKNPRQDSEVVKKRNKGIQSYLSQMKAEIKSGQVIIYAIDEVHLLEGDLIHHGWGKSQERFKIPLDNEKNRQTYYGALNLTNSDLILRAYPQGNGESTVSFLKELMKLNPDRKIQIFWDGVPYHRGDKMRDFLESVNQGLTPDN
jgi:transposase